MRRNIDDSRQAEDFMEAKTGNKRRRRPPGSAWHWRQTDCWYHTPPGTKRRVALRDVEGQRFRGQEHRKAAEQALARLKLAGRWRPAAEPTAEGQWVVAQICAEYLQYCQRGVAQRTLSQGHHEGAVRHLNDLCSYCGALPVSQLKKGHVRHWIESHATWRSPATCRNVIAVVLAAFNYAQQMHGVPHLLKGLKKPASRPRRHSLNAVDEEAI